MKDTRILLIKNKFVTRLLFNKTTKPIENPRNKIDNPPALKKF